MHLSLRSSLLEVEPKTPPGASAAWKGDISKLRRYWKRLKDVEWNIDIGRYWKIVDMDLPISSNFINVDVGLINRPCPLQGQQDQQGFRLEVLEDHIPLIKMIT